LQIRRKGIRRHPKNVPRVGVRSIQILW
jgi:hypothetical protein